MKKFVTTKENARIKKDILPPVEYLIPKKVEEKEIIVRESIKIIKQNQHGKSQNAPRSW